MNRDNNNNDNENDTRVYDVEQWQWTPVLRFLVETERETRLRLSREHELGVTPPMLSQVWEKLREQNNDTTPTMLQQGGALRIAHDERFLYCLFRKDIGPVRARCFQ